MSTEVTDWPDGQFHKRHNYNLAVLRVGTDNYTRYREVDCDHIVKVILERIPGCEILTKGSNYVLVCLAIADRPLLEQVSLYINEHIAHVTEDEARNIKIK